MHESSSRPRSAARRPPRGRSRTPAAVLRRRRAVGATLVLAAIALSAGAIVGGGGAPRSRAGDEPGRTSGSPAGVSRADTTRRGRRGPYAVGEITLTLSEPAAPPLATATDGSGQPVRRLLVVVRYPARGAAGPSARPDRAPATADGPFGLVVFSPGYDIAGGAYAALLDAWARAGFVVAEPAYPHTDPTVPGGVAESDLVNHPADLRFIIAALQRTSADPGSALDHLLVPGRVAVVGHSDGGDVSLAVAEDSCCSDPAVKAAVILSGAELSAFGGSYATGGGGVPLLVVQGGADTINRPACSVTLYDRAPAPKYYLAVPAAEHDRPYLDPGPMRRGVTTAVTAFLDAYLNGRPVTTLATMRRHGALPAGETLTSGPAAPPNADRSCPGSP